MRFSIELQKLLQGLLPEQFNPQQSEHELLHLIVCGKPAVLKQRHQILSIVLDWLQQLHQQHELYNLQQVHNS
jgi:hypothetical protein